ncbi:aldose 1-epimerase [Nocardioides terrae]|uniref:Aldose 1-epimerase n=1 Tax=Nocardioides terrae TaxID=574651 RepID=A0A1I1N2E3_9ACTN|nr:aldose epimerase family protein [Nocardioides terrae]SFC91807.1 aldose 1-epimerase [Nocardioides terrae]
MGFGEMPDGRPVERVTIGAAPGVEVDVLTLGATAHRVQVTGGDGVRRDVVLGRDTVPSLLGVDGFLGATIGRYANRIAAGRFTLDGVEVVVATNDRGNSLHGGADGWDKRLWTVESVSPTAVTLALVSADGDMGFPGEVAATVTYEVDGATVRITHTATTSAPTVVNMTNHSYFNLDGDGAGTIDGHTLQVHADRYTPIDATGIPLDDHAPVDDTPFDLRTATVLGPVLRVDHPQLAGTRGIDHNFVVRGEGLRPVAVLSSPATRTSLELSSDQQGLQVYAGNGLFGPGRSGRRYRPGDGIALEPQVSPDTPNRPSWPSARLEPGQTYRSVIEWRFSAL